MMPIVLVSFSAKAMGACVCLFVAVIAFFLRTDTARRHRVRLDQLERSAQLLALHAHDLELFMDAPEAPASLKQLAMRWATFIENKQAVVEFTAWASRQPLGRAIDSDDLRAVNTQIDALSREAPGVARSFSSALVNGALGAILRWPESAKLLAISSIVVVSDPAVEVAAAVRASNWHDASPPFTSAARTGMALAG